MALTDTLFRDSLVQSTADDNVYTFNNDVCTAKVVFADSEVKYAEIIDRTKSITYSFPNRLALQTNEPFDLEGDTSDFAFDFPTSDITNVFESVLQDKHVKGTPDNIVTMDLELDSDVIANIEAIAASQAVSFNAALINLITEYSNSVIAQHQ